ncbi:MAG: alpha-amylase family glycosyl hydrolase [Chloroflexi bacterium]|nr:alpha-amylase family glycosyl hydrolase [Chloroflexota bacterium]
MSVKRSAQPNWLETALIYNLYPQSFYDSNGDGIGDLPGIIAKLDYIQSLGFNVIWLNPIYESPFGDAGYDVSDYCKVAPRYGTNADAERPFAEARKRGIRVLLDFVAGHTSVEHPWFKQSAQLDRNRYSNWYIWSESTFGPAGDNFVGGFSERDGRYLPNFFYFQPALNYGYARADQPWKLPVDHPDVLAMRDEMDKVMRYWLDMGASGFRVDMASSLIKEDSTGKYLRAHWRRIREWMARDYPEAILLSEWSFPKQAIPAGFHIDFMIHFGTPAYTSLFRAEPGRDIFDRPGSSFFDRAGRGDIHRFLDIYLDHYSVTQRSGLISLPSGNHDIPRINECRDVDDLKVIYAFLLTMPGVPALYYGDEIGMRNVKGLPSKEGGYVRTQARTPMQWDDSSNAGFSTAPATALYLPIDPDPQRPTVAGQVDAPDSLLSFVRDMVQLRRSSPALTANGNFKPLYAPKARYPFIYERSARHERGGRYGHGIRPERFIIAVNPSGQPAEARFALESDVKSVELVKGDDAQLQIRRSHARMHMPPVSFSIYRMC